MKDQPSTGSLFPSSQSMGAFGSLPIPDLGAEEGEFESHDAVVDEESGDEEE